MRADEPSAAGHKKRDPKILKQLRKDLAAMFNLTEFPLRLAPGGSGQV
jgi:hypothetical protein